MKILIRLLFVFVLIWQCFFHVSDSGIAVLVVFLHHFLHLLSSVSKSEFVGKMADACPSSLFAVRKLLGVNQDQFSQYVACTKCHSIYEYEQCIQTRSDGSKISRHCWYVQNPNHPHQRQRKPCGTILLDSFKSRNGCVTLKPRKVFCYRSLKESLTHLLKQKRFLEMCQEWRHRDVLPELIGDIYDGNVWREFLGPDGKTFADSPYNLMVLLNVDWFQPFTHLTYSVGAMYLSFQNLPRRERYRMENIVLLGIIPGPKEPKNDINSYLSHFVVELKEFWHGVEIPVSYLPSGHIVVRLALIGLSCDLPAVRKVCGFLGHSAILGCSKCLYHFKSTSFENKLDYPGFDRSTWPERNEHTHRANASKYDMAKTQTERQSISSKCGIRSSLLLQLPYFNPIRYHVVDPMHNLLLGTAKHMMIIWTRREILNSRALSIIEERVESITTPKDIGRLPTKIASSFAGFTADQWKNWTIIFSPVVLKGLLPENHLRCWLLFVKACILLCTRTIYRKSLDSADICLLQFCKKFQELYSSSECTPNMHMHLHLKDCVLDYGPVYSFWLFAFERYNGILGSYQTNNRLIEVQLMRKFVSEQIARSIELPSVYSNFKDLLPQSTNKGSLKNHNLPCSGQTVIELHHLSSPCDPSQPGTDYGISNAEELLHPVTEKVMTSDHFKQLSSVYNQLYPDHEIHHVQRAYIYSKRATLGGELLVSHSFNKKQSLICAYWPGFGASIKQFDPALRRVGRIVYFMKHCVSLKDTASDSILKKTHIFCRVQWHQYHTHPTYFGSSAIVCTNLTETEDLCCFLPLKRISSRCAVGNMKIDFGPPLGEDSALVAIPLILNYNI